MFFDGFGKKYVPLADRYTPESIDEIRGQKHLLGEDGILKRIIEAKKPFNLLFYGPPGTGKTQVAKVLSKSLNIPFVKVNACTLEAGEWKKTIQDTVKGRLGSIILILDEIHRLNKLQQEFLLPYLETGKIYLIGITSENPFYTLSKALLSRVLPLEFKRLNTEDVLTILKGAINNEEKGLGMLRVSVDEDVLTRLAELSEGDARRALGYLEILTVNRKPPVRITSEDLKQLGTHGTGMSKDEFYDTVSAFIKSMRVGDKEAAIYYMMSLLKKGVDARYILRRMLIFAAEDIGLADPLSLVIAASGEQAFERTGDKEGKIILSFLAQYLTTRKKSNDALSYLRRVESILDSGNSDTVPGFLRHGRRREGKYINPHRDEVGARKQKYISDKLRDRIRGKEV